MSNVEKPDEKLNPEHKVAAEHIRQLLWSHPVVNSCFAFNDIMISIIAFTTTITTVIFKSPEQSSDAKPGHNRRKAANKRSKDPEALEES